MSNHLAIATVTETLAALLLGPVRADVLNATVTPGRPDVEVAEDAVPDVRLYLYRVEPNPHWGNADLPTRRSNGSLIQRPQAALTLNYLLTFIGDETTLVPQRLLASTVRALHSRPLLSREMIRNLVEQVTDLQVDHYLEDSDLAEQQELVRFTPLNLSLDELSNLWSVFFQTAYQLSVAYEAAVVLLSPDEAPVRPLPVLEPRIYAVTFRRPVIDRVKSAAGVGVPVTEGGTIQIAGSQLRGEITRVRVGSELVDVPPAGLGDTLITLTLPAGLRAGLIGVQIVHRALLGEPAEERIANESNIAPLILHPRIRLLPPPDEGFDVFAANVEVDDDGIATGEIVVALAPDVGQTQRVTLLLNQIDPPAGAPGSYTFEAPSRVDDDAPDAIDRLRIPFAGVVSGSYLVRIQVDGAESALVIDDDDTSATYRRYIGPRVEVA